MVTSPLTTQCPTCQQVLAVTLHQLAQARGRAVCGHCQASFDALARLALEASGPATRREPYPRSNELPRLTPPTVSRPTPKATSLPPAAAASATSAPRLRQPARQEPPAAAAYQPGFARTARPRWWRYAPILLPALSLIVLLGAGWALWQPLSRIPLTGPGLAWLCSVTGCQLPARRDVSRLQLLARDVRANPAQPGQLAVNLTIRNSAWFSQPYPIVSVHLKGEDQRPLSSATFRPEQYLGHPPLAGSGIRPGAELTISLQMNDPGATASSFSLDFH